VEVTLTRGRRAADAIAMLVVAAVSLFILVYIAFGEARRNYERFQIEKLISQGQIAQSALETFVRPGLPMQQFVGFAAMAGPMVEADPLIDNVSAYDASGTRVFTSSGGTGIMLLPANLSRNGEFGTAEIRSNGQLLQVVLPIKNRFEAVGSIVLSAPRKLIDARVEQAFMPLLGVAGLASMVFAAYVILFAQNSAPSRRARLVGIAFALKFILVSIFVVHTLLSVYAQGAQARAKAIADSIAMRLDDVVSYGLSFDEFTGIIPLVEEYKRLNPDLRAAAVLVDGKLRAHSVPVPKDGRWITNTSDFEYSIPLSAPTSAIKIDILVAMPKDVVYRQVMRSGKNFVALFVACGFIAILFMGVARSLQYISMARQVQDPDEEERATLNLVKPVFFLAVFVEHLNYSFLPQLMSDLAKSEGLSSGFTSLPFLAYYACFALSLVPAGRLEDRFGSRKLIILGLGLASLGIGLLSFSNTLSAAIMARALAGIGQGTLFIGVQSYVLANSSPHRKTQAGSAIVFGFQAGMIAGMAIGSLLVSYIDPNGVFNLGAALALVTMCYATFVLPKGRSLATGALRSGAAWRDVGQMLSNSAFLKSMFFIGVPAKAVLTGVVIFAMPLLLSSHGFAREDIGQITMVYAAGVIMASTLISKYADQSRQTERVLVYGGMLTALGMLLIATVDLDVISGKGANPALGTFVIVLGISVIGVAHGFINAPVVTHVAESRIAQELGVANVTSTYRLIERFGHMLGPVCMSQLFVFFGASWSLIGCIGIGILALTLMFPDDPKPIDSIDENPAAA
jgi:MFS family permease